MARERKRPEADPPALSMTPMIDVVFQLLIYFIVTLHPVDVVTFTDVFQPAPDPNAKPEDDPPPLQRVEVFWNGYQLNGVPMSIEKIDANLKKFHEKSPKMTLMIAVSANAPHKQLVKLLDSCAHYGIKSLSIVHSPI